MYFANPWGLVGLVSLPIIVAIHLYHRRFPPLQVAGLHLWTQDVRKDSPGRKRESLPITRSLILELLAALLISLLLADPRFDNAESTPHLIVILDDSASMGARIDGKSSRDRAAEWIQQAKDSLGRTALYSVLTSGARPTLIAGPRCAWEDVEVALQKWQPQSPRHDFQPTWDLAAQLAGEAEGRMVFLTDRIPEEEISLPQRMETFALGRTSGNIGFTTARWLFDAETGEGTLFARVANFGTTDQEVQISGKSNNSSILTQSVPLAAQSEKSLEWTVPGRIAAD
ncbi:MAG: BatA and WFA domain-containing protein [Planctomycetaceae bacterium]|nr:BatA and WFA domain-containing protein [Planctomycetaceae bacterium]